MKVKSANAAATSGDTDFQGGALVENESLINLNFFST